VDTPILALLDRVACASFDEEGRWYLFHPILDPE
jgi:hypothetical protein